MRRGQRDERAAGAEGGTRAAAVADRRSVEAQSASITPTTRPPLPTIITWLPQPEFAESVLVLLEHVPHPEAAAVRPVPLRQLLVVGVAGERHDAAVRWFDLGRGAAEWWSSDLWLGFDGLLCRAEKRRSGWCD